MRVAQLRTAFGDSLREASLRTGISHATIARIERGDVRHSSHETLRKIAKGYAVSFQYLLTGHETAVDLPAALRTELAIRHGARPDRVGDYVLLLVKAMEAGVEPYILDTALDLLIMKHQAVLAMR